LSKTAPTQILILTAKVFQYILKQVSQGVKDAAVTLALNKGLNKKSRQSSWLTDAKF